MKNLFTINADGLIFAVKATPNAKKNYIGDIFINSKNQNVLKIYITATATDGKANEAIITLLSTSWKLRKNQIGIILGFKNRNKIFYIKGQPKDLIKHLSQYTDYT